MVFASAARISGVVEGLEGISAEALSEVANEAERDCTISTAIRGAVSISHDVVVAR